MRLIHLAAVISIVAGLPSTARAQKGNSKLITRGDVEAHPDAKTALELIERIRPGFLRQPSSGAGYGGSSAAGANGRRERSLFVDEILQDRLDNLDQIPAAGVLEIRLMSPEDVVLVLGKQNHIYGAIAVTTTRSRGPGPQKKP